MTAHAPSLTVADLQAWYGRSHILHGVSLSLTPGRVVGLLGRNGVGKTTTLRALFGLCDKTRGSARLGDRELIGQPTHEMARAGIAYVPEDRRIFPSLSVEENLRLAAAGHSHIDEQIERIYDMFPDLREKRKLGGTTLSGGQQEMLAVGRALVADPSVLLLDEPSQGLSPIFAQSIIESVADVARQGVAVLLVEQNVSLTLQVADEILVMSDKGEISRRLTRDEIERTGIDVGDLVLHGTAANGGK